MIVLLLTRGSRGALHIRCLTTRKSGNNVGNATEGENEILVAANRDENVVNVKHVFREISTNDHKQGFVSDTEYQVHSCGVLRDVSIVDTTGAGDAFIGGYLMVQLQSLSRVAEHRDDQDDHIQFGLQFGAWVGGGKLSGPGARSALPSGSDVDKCLGKDEKLVRQNLDNMLYPFR